MKKIMFYCQYVLGMGHLMRTMALVQRLQDFQICFVSGGEKIPGFEFPSAVSVVNLPPLISDPDFQGIGSVDGRTLAEIERVRTQRLLDVFERFQPDVLIIELFPFGRKKFSFELLPLLARARTDGSGTKVVCSLRDILVSRDDQEKYEARVVRLLQRYFDALLVHADPQFQRLEESFSRVADIDIPVVYTGYVVQAAPPDEIHDLNDPVSNTPLLLVSIGGGRVGFELVRGAIGASALLQNDLPHSMLIFTGPFLPDEEFSQLQEVVADQPHITLRSYTNRFPAFMRRADLSISLAGYNTCMDILSAGVPALVLPFAGGGNNEQAIRARRLEELGVVGVISPEELEPQVLATKIKQRLRTPPGSATLDMRGAENTAAFLHMLLTDTAVSHVSRRQAAFPADRLKAALERLESQERAVDLFLRDDDVDEDEESLRVLLDIGLSRGVPINLEVIPGLLTDAAIRLLKEHKRLFPSLVEFNQHGWRHLNHEASGRKCEFGPSRTFEQQLADIAQGKAILEECFGKHFYPLFTPPWNRCTSAALDALDQLGFAAFSKDQAEESLLGYRFREISITLDIFRWRGGLRLKSPEEIVEELVFQLGTERVIGIMLHHKVMDAEAFALVDHLLAELRRSSIVHFHTFQGLSQRLNLAPPLAGAGLVAEHTTRLDFGRA